MHLFVFIKNLALIIFIVQRGPFSTRSLNETKMIKISHCALAFYSMFYSSSAVLFNKAQKIGEKPFLNVHLSGIYLWKARNLSLIHTFKWEEPLLIYYLRKQTDKHIDDIDVLIGLDGYHTYSNEEFLNYHRFYKSFRTRYRSKNVILCKY